MDRERKLWTDKDKENSMIRASNGRDTDMKGYNEDSQ